MTKTETITFDKSLSDPDCYVVCLVESRDINGTRSMFWDVLDTERTRLVQSEIDIVAMAQEFGYQADRSQNIDVVRRWVDEHCGKLFIEDDGYFS